VTDYVQHAHTTGDNLLRIRPRSKRSGTAETADSEQKERSLLYAREFQWFFWRVHKEQPQNCVYNLRHIWARLTTSEALNGFSF